MATICARGAMAARSPVMRAVVEAAERGVPVLGVCNGFQVLTEAGLLPGALMRNAGLNFVCRDVALTVENAQIRLHQPLRAAARRYRMSRSRTMTAITPPIAETLDRLEGEGRVAFRYAGDGQRIGAQIAGILNASGNVLGMMPHPERKIEAAHGGNDGRRLFEGLLDWSVA